MKKFFALLLSVAILVSLVACAQSDSGNDVTDDTTADNQEATGTDDTTVNNQETNSTDDTTADNQETNSTDDTDADTNSAETNIADSTLSEIIAAVMSGIDEDTIPSSLTEIPIDADMFEYYTFIPYEDGFEGLAYEPMIGSIPWSVVLVRVPEGTDAETVASSIKENADPRKWICVEADIVETYVNGDVVMLIMVNSENHSEAAEKMAENFKAL